MRAEEGASAMPVGRSPGAAHRRRARPRKGRPEETDPVAVDRSVRPSVGALSDQTPFSGPSSDLRCSVQAHAFSVDGRQRRGEDDDVRDGRDDGVAETDRHGTQVLIIYPF